MDRHGNDWTGLVTFMVIVGVLGFGLPAVLNHYYPGDTPEARRAATEQRAKTPDKYGITPEIRQLADMARWEKGR